ncbi:hypothetical protein C8Q76DRAFT_796195 [Earliella scabrosa]|nr:hypothetical protein C8Q76DRAFT_796195 [Earliella scabrosa]
MAEYFPPVPFPLQGPIAVPYDVLVNVIEQSPFNTLQSWRCTCRDFFQLVGSILRSRYNGEVGRFVDDVEAFNTALLITGAVVAGSTALKILLPHEGWVPGDMDIYVGNPMYQHLIALVTRPCLSFKLVPKDKADGKKSALSAPGTGMLTVSRYSTPKGRHVDIVCSSFETPLSPLHYYWSSLLINYVTPTHSACGYPDLTLHRAGLIKGCLNAKDVEALQKYNDRGFTLVDDGWWRLSGRNDANDLDPWKFGDSSALVCDYRMSPLDERPSMPVFRDKKGWFLRVYYPPPSPPSSLYPSSPYGE